MEDLSLFSDELPHAVLSCLGGAPLHLFLLDDHDSLPLEVRYDVVNEVWNGLKKRAATFVASNAIPRSLNWKIATTLRSEQDCCFVVG